MDNITAQWNVEECIFGNNDRYNEFISHFTSNDRLEYDTHSPSRPSMLLASLATARNYGFYDKYTYRVSNYSKYLKEEFLNDDYIILPLSKLSNPSDKIARVIGELSDDKFFIKPDSGFKHFTGDTVEYSEIGSFCRKLLAQGVSKNELCVISSAKEIESFEYRFWVIGGKIITSSTYSWSDMEDLSEDELKVPQIIKDYVLKVIKNIQIPHYTIDICETDEYFKVVEINNIYTSGTYNCDLEKLYNGLRKMAVEEYEGLL